MPQNTLEIVLRLQLQQAERDQKKVDTLMRNIERSATRAGASVERGMGRAERGTRGFIRSAVDLQAVLQMTERIANQTGAALRNAAAGTAVQQSFRNLARTSGVNADKLLENMRRASKGTVRELDLIRIANRAMLAGGAEFAEDLPQLFEIARAASIATGQSIGFVFDTLTRGIAKASPLLIDNAEIYIKIGQAVDQYAESIGKSVEALTMQERQFATRNAVLLQGSKLVQQVGSDTEAATDSFDRWNAKLRDAQHDLLGFVNKLGPVGPLLYTTSQLLTGLAPLMTAYVLLKRQASAASFENTAALTAETTATSIQTTAITAQTVAMERRAAAQAIMVRGGAQKAAAAGAAGGGLQIGAALASGAGLASVLAGVAAGTLVYENAIRRLKPELLSVGDIFDRGGKSVEYFARKMKFGKEVADEWLRAQIGMKTHAEKGQEATQAAADELAEYVEEIKDSDDAVVLYNHKVDELNESLIDYEVAQGKMTRSQFEFRFQIETTTEAILLMADAFERMYSRMPFFAQITAAFNNELERHEEQMAEVEAKAKADAAAKLEQADALKIALDALRDSGIEGDALRKKQEALRIAFGETTREALDNKRAIELFTLAHSQGVITLNELERQILASVDGVIDLAEAERVAAIAATAGSDATSELNSNRLKQILITRKLAGEESKLADRLQESIASLREQAATDRLAAAQQLADQLENLARNHAGRMEDIERRYRRRIQDIERNYTRTVAKAAEERDAEAIYDARIARQDQLREAELDRGDSLRSENRSYGEAIQAARDAYDQRVREINIRLQEEIQNERDAHAKELADLRTFYRDQLREIKAANKAIEDEEWRHQQELVRAHNWGRRNRPSSRPHAGGTGGTGMQHGGSGVVTGPASFFVESGVREAYWFSGAMSGAQQPATGGFAMQPSVQGINVNLGGRLDVTGLPEKIASEMGHQVAQIAVDSIARSFEAAL